MSPILLLRIATGSLVLFLIGHTLGTVGGTTRGPEEAAVVATMQNYHFDVMGVTRTHWDFYYGLGLYLSAALALSIGITLLVTGLARTHPAAARPFAGALSVGMVLFAVLSWWWFFPAPAVLTTVAAISFGGAAMRLR